LPYELLDEKGKQLETPGRYLLSPKDLAGISLLPRLIEAGVSAIKIEGRMKSPEYVAIVTGVYRAALDRATARSRGLRGDRGRARCARRGVQPRLHDGYLDGIRDERLMGYDRPNNRGVPVGRVASASPDRVRRWRSTRRWRPGTRWSSGRGAGRFGQKVALLIEGPSARSPAGSRATMRIDKPLPPATASSGSRARRWRTLLAAPSSQTTPAAR
jgi:hypothetical protein